MLVVMEDSPDTVEADKDVPKIRENGINEDFILELNKLLSQIESSDDPSLLIEEYLKKSQQCDEILNKLRDFHLHHNQLAIVYTFLGYVLIHIANALDEYESTGVHVSLTLLDKHAEQLTSILAEPSLGNKAVISVFHCLTGMVTMGGACASKVLTCINWSKVPFVHYANSRNPKSHVDVRTMYTLLVFAFLKYDDESLVSHLVSIDGFIVSLFRGLPKDSPKIVTKFLNFLTTKVTKNYKISKTTKIKDIFSVPNCLHLLNLYKSNAEVEKGYKRSFSAFKVSIDEKTQMKQALHQLFMVLGTDFRFGIVFKETEQKISERKDVRMHCNNHIIRIITSFELIWQYKECQPLLVAIFGTCPDTVRVFTMHYNTTMNTPQANPKFTNLVKVFEDTIKIQTPWISIEEQSTDGFNVSKISGLNIVSYQFMTKTLSCPLPMVKHAISKLMLAYLTLLKTTINKINLSSILSENQKKEITGKLFNSFDRGGYVSLTLKQYWDDHLIKLDENVLSEQNVEQFLPRDKTSKLDQIMTVLQLYLIYSDLFGVAGLGIYENFANMFTSALSNLAFTKERTSNPTGYKLMVKYLLQLASLHQKEGLIDLQSIDVQKSDLLGECSSDSTSEISVLNEKTISKTDLLSTFMKFYHFFQNDQEKESDLEGQTVCLNLIFNALKGCGISDCPIDFLKLWLDKMPQESKVELGYHCQFFACIINKCTSNLSLYVDSIIDLKNKSNMEINTEENILSALNNIENVKNVNDTDDVNLKDISWPFSCLIVGASTLISSSKEHRSKLGYFSAVISDYMHFCSDPSLLATYLVGNNTLLDESTKTYVKSWIDRSKNSKSMDIDVEFIDVGESNMSDKLRTVFITHTHPSISELDLESSLQNQNEVLNILRRLLVYISLENQQRKQNKPKGVLKFYVKLFKKIVEKILDGENDKRTGIILKFLTEHPALLEIYEPFSPNAILPALVDRIIAGVISSSLSSDLAIPFRNKMIKSLKSSKLLVENDFYNSADVYIENDNLSCIDVEKMLTTCFTNLSNSTESLNQLVNQLLKLMIRFLDAVCRPNSTEIEVFYQTFLSIGLDTSRRKVESYRETMTLISKVLLAATDNNTVGILMAEEATQIGWGFPKKETETVPKKEIETKPETYLDKLLKVRPFPTELCSHIVQIRPMTAPIMTEYLRKNELKLSEHSPILVDIAKTSKRVKGLEACLKKVKPELKLWMESKESDQNKNYELLLDHSISMGIWEYGELKHICKTWYKSIFSEDNVIPPHIVNLIPCYKFLCLPLKKLESKHSEDSWMVKLVCLSIAVLAKLYGKDNFDNTSLELTKIIDTYFLKTDCEKVVEKLDKHDIWDGFVKKILKHSLKDSKFGCKMLECLSKLCIKMYVKDSACTLTAKSVLEMLMSHSEYINVMLSHDETSLLVKEKLLKLQIILLESNPDILEEKHVPLILGAYGATMSLCDQVILKLLLLYERHDRLSTSPTLWGKAAISFFTTDEKSVAIDKQPEAHQTLAILDANKVVNSALKFDSSLGLEPIEIDKDNPSIYDQRFLLMLFLNLTSDDQELDIMELADKGCLAFAIAALTSECEFVWRAGAALLKNCTELFQNSKYTNRKRLWIWAIYFYCYGLSGKQTRVPTITANYLIKGLQLLQTPAETMALPVLNHIYLRPALDLFQIPELYRFYFSESVETYKDEMLFLMDLLATSVRNDLDVSICVKQYVPRLVLGLLTGPNANWPLRASAISVLKSMVDIPSGVSVLTIKHGLIAELNAFLQMWKPGYFNVICLHIIDILQRILKYLSNTYKQLKSGKVGVKRKQTNIQGNASKRQKSNQKQAEKEKKIETSQIEVESPELNNQMKIIGKPQEFDKQNNIRITSNDVIALLIDLRVTLSTVTPLAVGHLPLEYVNRCLCLLMDFSETFKEINLSVQTNDFLKNPYMVAIDGNTIEDQVRNWVNKDTLCKRLNHHLTHADEMLLHPTMDANIRQTMRSKNLAQVMAERKCVESSNSTAEALLTTVRKFFS